MKIHQAHIEYLRGNPIDTMWEGATWGGSARVMVALEDGPTEQLFAFYHDEISFTADEFVGLTKEEGMALFAKKDIAYLQSP